ncbi:MAG: DEAD/DEAH box helicase family protein [Planctomycetota bacterium]|nr:DEAD/DEAH box helicase family protein [Planctomycetota bacterium]
MSQNEPEVLDIAALRAERPQPVPRTPFGYQLDAMGELNKTFQLDGTEGKAGLLVLPTGAGKTYTTVKWLCDRVLPLNLRVLWLANSYYLLDQAFDELRRYARWIPAPRQQLSVRVVSSNPRHAWPGSIQTTDDMIVMTTQTAIKNLHLTAENLTGDRRPTPFRSWIEATRFTGLFIVLDEAHHAPAHGCRNLLIGEDPTRLGIRRLLPKTNLLGLTATPTYTDESRRGWLGRIFTSDILFKIDKTRLVAEGILARPIYVQRPTGRELTVPDDLYNKLMREKLDLPEDIIEKLANDSLRNDAIVQEYVQHRDMYGKTIIFADRWFQCVYLKEKLLQKGVRCDAIYSKVGGDSGSADERNARTADDNSRILDQFRNGQGSDALDVLINVRMLTEGADVPSVRTVFLTRQTTSQILMTQMIGRAMRGRRAGGGDEAHIVLFMDEWKRLIDWATPALLAGEYISIRLVEELARQINNPDGGAAPPFASVMPVGWYRTESLIAPSADDGTETQAFTEFVMVYDENREKFEDFIRAFLRQMPEGWDHEYLDPDWMKAELTGWINQYFDRDNDEIGNTLDDDLCRLARHMAQKQSAPAFHSFEERTRYDLDSIARKRMDFNARDNHAFLNHEFNTENNLWQVFYKSYERFAAAFDGAMRRALHVQEHGEQSPRPPERKPRRNRELTEAEKSQVKKRDGMTCLCCGATGKGVKLQIDHVFAFSMGGESTIENSQTLCSVCNRTKQINEVNFRISASTLRAPRELELLPREGREETQRTITRLVNYFYRCKAACRVLIHTRRSGQHYADWKIELYSGNDPKWLSRHKRALLEHVQETLGCDHVESIEIVAATS